MILHAIELTYAGVFRETVRLGPFAPGLNVLALPNESGKTTAIRAAARALFDKHTTRGEELKSLQPVGSDLSPRISVEFETNDGRYRIEKTFLQSPRSLLRQWLDGSWQAVAEGDAADLKMQDLLRSSIPGRGATKPEHWGFLGFLWARQGEAADWPRLDDENVGHRIRACLARIELDPVIESLRGKLFALADSVITSTGQAKAGGPLRQAEEDLIGVEGELSAVRHTQAELETLHQSFNQLSSEVDLLAKERIERETAQISLAEQALSAEKLRGDLEIRKVELSGAQEKLLAVTNDSLSLDQRSTELPVIKIELKAAEDAERAAVAELAAIRQELTDQEAKQPNLEEKCNTLRAAHSRILDIVKLRGLSADTEALRKQTAKAEKASSLVASLQQDKAKIATISPASLKKLEAHQDTVRELKAQVLALGLTVELTPEHDGKVTIKDGSDIRRENLEANQLKKLSSPNSLDITLAGWGKVSIRSGAKEAKNLQDDLIEAEGKLRDSLTAAGVPNLEAAREAMAARKDIDTHIAAAESSLAALLGDFANLPELLEAAAAADRRLAVLSSTSALSPKEEAFSDTHLESEDSKLALAIPAAETELKALNKALDRLRVREREATESVQATSKLTGEQRSRLESLESKISELSKRYGEGIEAATSKARLEFAKAEARTDALRAQLPLEFEKLPERNRRASAALQQITNDLQSKRAARDAARGSLESLGGLGLYSKETNLEERKVEAEKRRDAARAKGWAARIAHDLIVYRKQVATKAVLAPLEERLTAAFAYLTGESGRRVFLDERLQVAGIGRRRDEVYPFEALSQGAKEQLLLCLRIAVAQELATTEPQVLILDDVLVNTDPVRQERVLDTLGGLSATLQVIILTCHPERYRGAGQAVALERLSLAGS